MNKPMKTRGCAVTVLAMTTLAFSLCFAAWVLNSVLVVYLVDAGIYAFDKAQVGWLLAAPTLTGAISRIPLGLLTDRHGGRPVFTLLLLVVAGYMVLLSLADGYAAFLAASLGFGLAGGGFAVGVGYLPLWFDRRHHGTVLGIFGLGNAGAAATTLLAPLLDTLTDGGADREAWRQLPQVYAALLVVMAGTFFAATQPSVASRALTLRLSEHLGLLRHPAVCRLGLHYALVFGAFVALTQWLVTYGINVYELSIAEAGIMAAVFGLPSGVIRVLGGWLSDRFGARPVMHWVYSISIAVCLLLAVPRMSLQSPGTGLTAQGPGRVTLVSPERIVAGEQEYRLKPAPAQASSDDATQVLPRITQWQEPRVRLGEIVEHNGLLARGVTEIYYPAHWWLFVALVFVFGVVTGIGKAGVYKLVTDHYPHAVGAVGGMVGMLGALGGFVFSLCFAHLLEWTGLWSSCWIPLALLSMFCLRWVREPSPSGANVTAMQEDKLPLNPLRSHRHPRATMSRPVSLRARWSRRPGQPVERRNDPDPDKPHLDLAMTYQPSATI